MKLWISLEKLGYSNYSASDMGEIRNNSSGKILNGGTNTGYRSILLKNDAGNRKNEYVHRLVLISFKGNRPNDNMTVDHINNDKLDNRLINLRWATPLEQIENRPNVKSSVTYKKVEQRSLDGTLIKIWDSRQEAAETLQLENRRISDACLGNRDGNIYGGFIWTNPEIKIYEDEIWKPCIDPNFDGFYVSSFGRVRTKSGKITYGANSKGYMVTSVRIDGNKITRAVHCLIAEAFFGKQDLLVNHKDGNKSNNRIENLEYVTYKENAQHAHDTGLHPGSRKTSVIQYDLNGNELARFDSVKEAKLALEKGDITSALTGRTKTAGGYIWKYANQ